MTSESIYRPTYLYIKQHTTTGKLYFGKTTRNPINYQGSGLHWKRHLRQHGEENVTTLWYELFHDKNDCVKFALDFSQQMGIVESTQWLNMKPENGLDGGSDGSHRKGKSHTAMSKEKIRKSLSGKHHSQETKLKMSITLSGRPQAVITCPHCGKSGGICNMKRYHFDKCQITIAAS